MVNDQYVKSKGIIYTVACKPFSSLGLVLVPTGLLTSGLDRCFQSGFLGSLGLREGMLRVPRNADKSLGFLCCRSYLYRLNSTIISYYEYEVRFKNKCIAF
jgi:hypothetical protein